MNKKMFLILCILLAGYGKVVASELPQVVHYSLKLELFLKEERFEAEAEVRVKNETEQTFTEIPFLLYRLLDVQKIDDDRGNPVEFSQQVVKFTDEKRLQVNLITVRMSEPLVPGDSVKIKMKYGGSIYGYPEVFRYVKDKISEEFSLIRPDAFSYPVLSNPSFRTLVYSLLNSKFTYDIQVTVPSGYTAACGGELTSTLPRGNSTVFSYRSKVPTWRMDIASAKYRILKDEEKKLTVYAFPQDEQGAEGVMDAVTRVVEFYSKSFGEVRNYKGYTIIEIPDGLGSQASDYYVLQMAQAFKKTGDFREVYHEIAHNWNVKAKLEIQRCRWFCEAFAEYFAALAVREFEGPEAFENGMISNRERFIKAVQRDRKNYDTPISEYARHELGDNSYTKGPWVLYVLHRIVGEQKFKQIIREFLSDFSDRPADFGDFRKIAERISGNDLAVFFDEWIYGVESSQYLMDKTTLEEIVNKYQ